MELRHGHFATIRLPHYSDENHETQMLATMCNFQIVTILKGYRHLLSVGETYDFMNIAFLRPEWQTVMGVSDLLRVVTGQVYSISSLQ